MINRPTAMQPRLLPPFLFQSFGMAAVKAFKNSPLISVFMQQNEPMCLNLRGGLNWSDRANLSVVMCALKPDGHSLRLLLLFMATFRWLFVARFCVLLDLQLFHTRTDLASLISLPWHTCCWVYEEEASISDCSTFFKFADRPDKICCCVGRRRTNSNV